MVHKIQPVVPVRLGQEWNLISRTALPVILQRAFTPGADRSFGLSEMVQSLFLLHERSIEGSILSSNLVFLIPTATKLPSQSSQLEARLTTAVFRRQDGSRYGVLVKHVWGVMRPGVGIR